MKEKERKEIHKERETVKTREINKKQTMKWNNIKKEFMSPVSPVLHKKHWVLVSKTNSEEEHPFYNIRCPCWSAECSKLSSHFLQCYLAKESGRVAAKQVFKIRDLSSYRFSKI